MFPAAYYEYLSWTGSVKCVHSRPPLSLGSVIHDSQGMFKTYVHTELEFSLHV